MREGLTVGPNLSTIQCSSPGKGNTLLSHSVCKMSRVFRTFANRLWVGSKITWHFVCKMSSLYQQCPVRFLQKAEWWNMDRAYKDLL